MILKLRDLDVISIKEFRLFFTWNLRTWTQSCAEKSDDLTWGTLVILQCVRAHVYRWVATHPQWRGSWIKWLTASHHDSGTIKASWSPRLQYQPGKLHFAPWPLFTSPHTKLHLRTARYNVSASCSTCCKWLHGMTSLVCHEPEGKSSRTQQTRKNSVKMWSCHGFGSEQGSVREKTSEPASDKRCLVWLALPIYWEAPSPRSVRWAWPCECLTGGKIFKSDNFRAEFGGCKAVALAPVLTAHDPRDTHRSHSSPRGSAGITRRSTAAASSPHPPLPPARSVRHGSLTAQRTKRRRSDWWRSWKQRRIARHSGKTSPPFVFPQTPTRQFTQRKVARAGCAFTIKATR